MAPTRHYSGDYLDFRFRIKHVAEKWLNDRKGRRLSSDDIEHYERTVAALEATIGAMADIDARIPGWPLS